MKLDPNQILRDLVIANPELRETLEVLGIDYCCGGGQPVGQAIEAAGKTLAEVEKILAEAKAAKAGQPKPRDWSKATLSALAEHIEHTHHTFTKQQLERLDPLLAKVEKAHSADHGPLLAEVRKNFDELHADLVPHFQKEEQILFPAIKVIEIYSNGLIEKPVFHSGKLENPIRQMLLEHDHAGALLAAQRITTDGFKLPEGACLSFESLYEGLEALERDLHEHIHLENNILFPATLKLEQILD